MTTIPQALCILDENGSPVVNFNVDAENHSDCIINYNFSSKFEIITIVTTGDHNENVTYLKDFFNKYLLNRTSGSIIYNIDTVKLATLIINNKTRITYSTTTKDKKVIETIEIANYAI